MRKITLSNIPGLRGNSHSVISGAGLEAETQATIKAATDYGLQLPGDITKTALLAGLGKVFLPAEMPRASQLVDLSPTSQRYFEKVIQPNLKSGIQRGNEKALAVAHQVGRLLGAGYGQLIDLHPPLKMGEDKIGVDGKVLPYEIKTGRVVELGMGVNGLVSHMGQIRKGAYTVIGVHRSTAEVAVLRGFSEYQQIDLQALEINSLGINKTLSRISEGSTDERADLLVASRVHMAGRELRTGMQQAGSVLREGGLVIARGPNHYNQGVGYTDILNVIKRNPELRVQLTHGYNLPLASTGRLEPNILVVARKV